MNESLVITPELASWLLTRYDFFESHEKATLEGLSGEVFESDLLEIGQQVWGTTNILEIIEHLKVIVKEQTSQEALVPENIKEFVAVYEKRAQEQKTAPPTRQSIINAWIKEYRLNEIRNALQTVVGKENAQRIAPLFESRLTEVATKREMATKEEIFTEDQLREMVRSTLLEAAPQIANRETVEEIATNIAQTSLGRRILPRGVEAIGVSRKIVVPRQPVTPTQGPVPQETRAIREAQLLLRVSYLRPSVVKQFFSQLGTLSPFRLLHVVGGEAYANSYPPEAGAQSLLLKGVTITLLRDAITQLREQHPEIAPNDPRVRTLEEIITAMEAYKSSHPGNYTKLESRAAEKVEVYVATPGEEVPATPGKVLRLQSIFDQAGKFQFLRIDTLSLKKGIRSLPGIIGRVVSYPFLYAGRFFFGKPAGGMLHALGGPRAVAAREGTFGVQRGVSSFAKGAFRQLGSFASDVFTRPTLGWLRWGLTGGFGLGAFTLPFPFNFASGGMAGITGATQLAHAAPNAGSFLSGLGSRLGIGAGGGGGIGLPRLALGYIPIIIIGAFLVIPVLAFMVITGAQGTFQGIGGTAVTGPATEIAKEFTPPPIDPSTLTFYWPINPSQPSPNCSSGYGWRFLETEHFHNGIDISAGRGTPIFPIADGKVYSITKNDPVFGNVIIIGHAPKLFSLYAHMDGGGHFAEGLDPNDPKKAEVLGGKTQLCGVDSTGNSTGDHLHLGTASTPSLKEGSEFLNSGKPAAFFPCDYLKQYCSRTPPCYGSSGQKAPESQPKPQPTTAPSPETPAGYNL